MTQSVVLGVDAGGSHTRAVCVGLDGRIRAVSQAGGGSPTHNTDARDQVLHAVVQVLDRAGVVPRDVVHLTAGLAGFNRDEDRQWADGFFGIPGLNCPRQLVNDTVVAHAGAFAGGPGVIVVAGTGSMILAISETGEQVRNDRYHHYAGGARHLSFDALARILIGDEAADDAFVASVFEYWDVTDRPGLRHRIGEVAARDPHDIKRFYGGMAPLVTAAAAHSELASSSCDWLAGVTSVGVRLVGAHVEARPVAVSMAGAVATDSAFSKRVATALHGPAGGFTVVDAKLDPVRGAALLALRAAGAESDLVLTNLGRREVG